MKYFAVMRAALVTLLMMMLSACAGMFGPPEPPAPIEDRVHKRVESAPVNTGAKTTPLPEQPRFSPRPLTTRPAAPAGAGPAPQLGMPDRLPAQRAPELSFPAEPLAPDDDGMGLPGEDTLDAPAASANLTPAPPALSPAVQSLVTAANTAAAEHNWDRATAALERAVKLAPAKSSVWRQLAAVHLQSGNPERAREVVQRALSLAAADGQENVAAWRLLGDIEQARGDAGAAQTARANAQRLMH